jgi:hypothetical protein
MKKTHRHEAHRTYSKSTCVQASELEMPVFGEFASALMEWRTMSLSGMEASAPSWIGGKRFGIPYTQDRNKAQSPSSRRGRDKAGSVSFSSRAPNAAPEYNIGPWPVLAPSRLIMALVSIWMLPMSSFSRSRLSRFYPRSFTNRQLGIHHHGFIPLRMASGPTVSWV